MIVFNLIVLLLFGAQASIGVGLEDVKTRFWIRAMLHSTMNFFLEKIATSELLSAFSVP